MNDNVWEQDVWTINEVISNNHEPYKEIDLLESGIMKYKPSAFMKAAFMNL